MIIIYESNKDFLVEYLDLLLQDEIKNNLIIGLSQRTGLDKSYFCASIIDDRILLGMLAGKNLILSANTLEQDVYVEMVHHMKNIDYPGIIGQKDECLVYQRIFENMTNRKMQVEMDQRIYSCSRVTSNYQFNGTVRLANMSDFPILRIWYYEFHIDIGENSPIEELDKSLQKVIEQDRLFVLEKDGVLLSMAGKARGTENSQTVAMVYTPKEQRNHGYASVVVEYVTRHILEYKRMATLYTDLSNPISNSIYMKIGYVPHCDSIVLKIEY